MIYGANGYTGELIAREAVRRGLKPILAGRREDRIASLAGELGLPHRAFGLDDAAAASGGVAGMSLVLNCAGPFSATARPMMEACLGAGAHYLDITGEIAVFEMAHGMGARARERGVALCPGVGFDVVPTDCLALALKDACPGAARLALGFDSRGRMSPGTAKTSVEGLAAGGAVRRDGAIVKVPLAWRTRRIDFGDGEKLAMTIPWGDVSTAFHTTGIPNIEVYVPASPALAKRLRRMNLIRPLLGVGPVQRFMKHRIEKTVRGPDEGQRARAPTWVWGEAQGPGGETVTGRVKVANGYDVTISASLAIVEHLLAHPASGHLTPARLMGKSFVETLPGSGRIEVG
jgi:short subunit dehydrogenase-like uncharacterized protein